MQETRTPQSFKHWMRSARAGDIAVYHEGFLAVDRATYIGDTRLAIEPLDSVAREAYEAQSLGLVDLVQQRMRKGRWTYLAIRRRRSTRK